jgi:hypothetical protein
MMRGRREARCQEAGREKLEECCKEQGQLAEASKEGFDSKWDVVSMMMMMMMMMMIQGIYCTTMHKPDINS